MRRLLFVTVAFLTLTSSATAETTDAWMRVDSDQQGQTIWVGATTGSWEHDIIFYPSSGLLEGDLGWSFAIGEYNTLLPMLGILHNPTVGELEWISPQLYWFNAVGKHSCELWALYYKKINDVQHDTHWILFQERYQISESLSVGPQAEWFRDYTDKKDFGRYVGFGMKIPYGTKSFLDLSSSKNTQIKGTAVRATFITHFD